MPFRSLPSALFLALLLVSIARAGAPSADFYVAPNGNDEWSGRHPSPTPNGSDGPKATLEGARDAIRYYKAMATLYKPFTVLVRGGTYRVSEPIHFTAQDSGADERPITYAAYPGEKPVFSGGVLIGGWTRQGDSPVWKTVIPEVKAGKWFFRQLFVNGRRAIPARFPNAPDTFRAAGPGVSYPRSVAARRDPANRISLKYENDDLKPWANLDDAVVVVYHSWTTSRHVIKRLDTAQRLVEFTAPSGWPMGWWEKNQRYYIESVHEGLDAPGEWYLNRRSGELFYYPQPDEDLTTAEVVAPQPEEILHLEGDLAAGKPVQHIRFEGLAFHHTDWIMPQAQMVDGQASASLKTATVFARGARHCTFERCEIAHTGGYGLWLERGSKDNRVVQCHLYDLGAGGVRLGETELPEKPELQAERNEVYNSFIHDGGHVYHAGIGVWIGRSSHNKVHHNEICDFLYSGVSLGWSWGYAPSTAHHNQIDYNHIHHLGYNQLSDMGGIYSLGDSPGTQFRYNLIHDVSSYSYGGWGLYTDEGSTGILMENNIVYRVKDGAFHQHYGKDNLVRNNILALSSTVGQVLRSREEKHNSFTLERNIIFANDVPLLGKNWSNGHFTLDYNCYWDASGKPAVFPGNVDLKKWQAQGHDVHSVVADPKFVAPEKFDFRLAPDSPALALGFQPIDTSTIGLVGSADWVALPKHVKRPPLRLPGE
jgi:hypothetical protein